MTYIVAFRKASDAYTVYSLIAPEGSIELCTLDGETYATIPGGAELPEQHTQVADSVRVVELDAGLRARISAASPHVALIRERVQAMIAEQYPMCEEIKLLRTAPSEEYTVYNEYAESCRQWGRDRKAELGL